MKLFPITRDLFVPKGAVKVSDKQSDAVAYLYTGRSHGKPVMMVFFGKQTKPVAHFRYSSDETRARAVTQYFADRRDTLARKAAYRKERTDYVPDYKVGDVLRTCWGYEQTNVEFFEVVEVKGKYAVLRELAQERIDTAHMQGRCVPLPGQYLTPRHAGDDRGQPIRRLMQQHGIRIDDVRTASRASSTTVAGVKVYESASWTAYH